MKALLSNRTKAHMAYVLFMLVTLLTHLNVLPMLVCTFIEDPAEQNLWTYCFISLIIFFVLLCGYGLLLGTRPNKPTRIALSLLIALLVVELLKNVGLYFIIRYDLPYQSYYVAIAIEILTSICLIYPYNLICRNNAIDQRDVTWFHIYIIFLFMSIACEIFFLFLVLFDLDNVAQTFWYETGMFKMFYYTMLLLMLIAIWRFTHCAAFTGTDEQKNLAKFSYLPSARFVVAVIVGLLLITTTSFLITYYVPYLLSIELSF